MTVVVYVRDPAVVVELVVVPISAVVAATDIAIAVVHTAIVANVAAPKTTMPSIAPGIIAPVSGSPQRARCREPRPKLQEPSNSRPEHRTNSQASIDSSVRGTAAAGIPAKGAEDREHIRLPVHRPGMPDHRSPAFDTADPVAAGSTAGPAQDMVAPARADLRLLGLFGILLWGRRGIIRCRASRCRIHWGAAGAGATLSLTGAAAAVVTDRREISVCCCRIHHLRTIIFVATGHRRKNCQYNH